MVNSIIYSKKRRGVSEMDTIVLDKSSYDFVIKKSLGLKNMKCKYCGIRIQKNNFGWIGKDVQCCNSPLCLSEGIRKGDILETKKEM